MASGIKAGKAFVEVGIGDKVSAGLNAIKKKFQDFGKGLANVGKSMMVLGGAITAPFVGAILKAADLEKQMTKFRVIFGDSADAVKAWGDEYANQIGRSKGEVAGLMAHSQQMLVPIGFDSSQATEMSKAITKLTMDMASFNSASTEDVSSAIMSALHGRTRAIREYGVSLNEAAVKQYLLSKGLDPDSANETQLAFARLQVILAQTANAQGDAVRSSGSFKNQLESLKASVSSAASSIGSVLLPAVTPLVGRIRDAIKASTEWVLGHKQLIIWAAQLGATLTIAGAAVFAFGKAITGVVSGITATVKIVSLLTSPVGLVIAAVAALGAAFVWLTAKGDSWGEKFKSIGDAVIPFIEKALATLQKLFSDLWTVIQPVLAALSVSVLTAMDAIGGAFRQASGVISDAISAVWGWIQPYIKPVVEWMVGAICGAIDAIGFAFKNWRLVCSYALVGFVYNVVKAVNQVIYFFTDVMPGYLRWFLDNWKEIFQTAWNFFKTFATNLGTNLVNLWKAIKGFFSGDGWKFEWTGLLEGFENTVKELPKIAEREITGVEKALGDEVDKLSGDMKQAWDDYQDAKKQKAAELAQQNQMRELKDQKAPEQKAPEAPKLPELQQLAGKQANETKVASMGIFNARAIQSLQGTFSIQQAQLDQLKAINKNTKDSHSGGADNGEEFA